MAITYLTKIIMQKKADPLPDQLFLGRLLNTWF